MSLKETPLGNEPEQDDLRGAHHTVTIWLSSSRFSRFLAHKLIITKEPPHCSLETTGRGLPDNNTKAPEGAVCAVATLQIALHSQLYRSFV